MSFWKYLVQLRPLFRSFNNTMNYIGSSIIKITQSTLWLFSHLVGIRTQGCTLEGVDGSTRLCPPQLLCPFIVFLFAFLLCSTFSPFLNLSEVFLRVFCKLTTFTFYAFLLRSFFPVLILTLLACVTCLTTNVC